MKFMNDVLPFIVLAFGAVFCAWFYIFVLRTHLPALRELHRWHREQLAALRHEEKDEKRP
jgi:hypothetical protein